VDVRTGVQIASATRRGARVAAIVTSTGESIPCDVVIVSAGVRPRTGLLVRAGARVLPNGAVRIDEHCQTSLQDVFACGSCVAVRHAVSDDLVWLPQASIVDKTAQVAGACAAGRDAELGAVLGTMILRAGDAVVARTGLAQADLGRAEVARVHPLSHDAYFPGASPLSIELAYDPRDGRVLAADAWGSAGVDKRIDVLATAIAGALTVSDVAALDLAYEAAFSSARDPVNVAGAVAYETAHEPGLVWAPEEVAGRPGVTFVDVRSATERAEAPGIAGARKSSLADVRAGTSEPDDASGPIVFVSSDGRSGYLAARLARARGILDAGFLSGGLRSWVASGLPLEAPAPKAKKKKAKKGAARRRA
jgi:rhodanese-related sulfurtransferase